MAILDPRSNLIGNLILRQKARREGIHIQEPSEERIKKTREEAEELAKKREFVDAGITAEDILRYQLSLWDDLYHEAREIFSMMTAAPTPKG